MAAWVSLAIVLTALLPDSRSISRETQTYLPSWAPTVQAIHAYQRHFGESAALSQAVVIIERTSRPGPRTRQPDTQTQPVRRLLQQVFTAPASQAAKGTQEESAATEPARVHQVPAPQEEQPAGTASGPTGRPATQTLTPADLAALNGLAVQLRQPLPKELADRVNLTTLRVRAPGDFPPVIQPNPLISPDGQAAILGVDLPFNFITSRAASVVEHVERQMRQARWPGGLEVAITGSAALGRDYGLATRNSERRTRWVALAAVLAILLLVYRAPLAAAVMLGSIGLAAVLAYDVTGIASRLGMHVGTAERIFIFVLLYGVGVDYCLLYLSRFGELLENGGDARQHAAAALSATAPSILAAAGTNTLGLAMLSFAAFGIFRQTGQAVPVALLAPMAAAVSLVPALAAILHRHLFWPRANLAGAAWPRPSRLWSALAWAVTGRPALILLIALALLAVPAWGGWRIQYVYDSVSGLDPKYDSIRGMNISRRHWPIGQIAPTSAMLVVDAPQQRQPAVAAFTAAAMRTPGVSDVRSLTQPLGRAAAGNPLTDWLLKSSAQAQQAVGQTYLSGDGKAATATVVLADPPLSNAALATVDRLRQAAGALPEGVRLHLFGSTPEMADTRTVIHRDFQRVAVLVLAVVFLIVLALVKDVFLAGFMVGMTVLNYLATLGIAAWAVVSIFGHSGMDWKVQIFLFVVLVAVGQDYNIFLAGRLVQEALAATPRQAARTALVRTGGMISSAGLIMAATLGSLMAGDIAMLVQMGLALSLGILLDTFIVRPLLVPAFVVLTGRTGRARRKHL